MINFMPRYSMKKKLYELNKKNTKWKAIFSKDIIITIKNNKIKYYINSDPKYSAKIRLVDRFNLLKPNY
ncbi:hypothetical protein BpHYR1_040221 [Brachionus plicatilis]|uniref:Uncharacterized protein n=1 Tax=Brachionus plicatilis TaxID=10195 RepID=A0A3M7S1E1_BRAPC|nr:hypothetical protein BpHYR1_040221 [Brachionus plicatilis]